MIDRARAQELDAQHRLPLRRRSSTSAHSRRRRVEVARGDVADCDVVFAGAPPALAAVVYGGAPLDLIEVEGDRALADRFVDLFPLPPKAALPSLLRRARAARLRRAP